MRKHSINPASLALVLVLLIALPIIAIGAMKTQELRKNADDPIEAATLKLENSKDIFARSSDRSRSQEDLASIAQYRRDLLLEEAKTNPQGFLSHARLASQRDSYPENVRQFIEIPVSTSGTFVIRHYDTFSKQEVVEKPLLEVDKSQTYEVYFPQQPPRPGSRVQVSGVALDTRLVVQNSITPREETLQHLPPRKQARIAAVAVRFSNDTDDPVSTTKVRQLLLTDVLSVKNYYLAASHALFSISADIFEPITISLPNNEGCGFEDDWAQEIENKLRSQGVALDQYTNYMYFITPPRGNGCGGIYNFAWADIGGKRSWITSNALTSPQIAHEVGHNLGINHANFYYCNRNAIDTDCIIQEYEDTTQLMGRNNPNFFQAAQKRALGWLPETNIQTVATTGTYTIVPIDYLERSGAVQALRIYKADTDEYYYLDFHRGVGLDSSLRREYTQGAILRVWNEYPASSTKLLNVHASSGILGNEAFADGSLFTDPVNRIRIKQLSHSTNSVTLSIEFVPEAGNPPTCIISGPTIITKDNLVGKYHVDITPTPGRTIENYTWKINNLILSVGNPDVEYGFVEYRNNRATMKVSVYDDALAMGSCSLEVENKNFVRPSMALPPPVTVLPLPTYLPTPAPQTQLSGCRVYDGDVSSCDAHSDTCAYYFCTNQCLTRGTDIDSVCGTSGQSSSTGTHPIGIPTSPAAACRVYDGNVAACDAHAGDPTNCAYYFCSNECWPRGTDTAIACPER